MADLEYWLGTVGPLLYEDTDEYPDGEPIQGIRVSQGYIEETPTEDYHVVRLEDLESALPDGTITGDIIRWNATTESWEVKSEPFEFKGLVLTPALASLVDVEGAMYYNSTDKAVKVCTNI